MPLVGDVILKARSLAPDMPPTLAAPDGLTVSAIADNTSTLTPGDYIVQITQFNNWGESNPTVAVTRTILANERISVGGSVAYGAWAGAFVYVLGDIRRPTVQNGHAYRCIVAGTSGGVQPTWPLNAGGTVVDNTCTWQEYGPEVPSGIVKYRVYYGIGSPTRYVEGASLPVAISAAGTAGSIPTRSTAFDPDADGRHVSARAFYDWLNDALKLAARITGGIRDHTGIASVNGSPHYLTTGQWKRLTHGWFDGYQMEGPVNRSAFFYRTSQTGQSGAFAVTLQSDRMLIELYPQPNRTAGSTTLSGALSATGVTASAVSTADFVLTFGLAMIGTEIVAYNGIASNQLAQLVRGLGGTKEQAWGVGTAVNELNVRFAGLRFHTQEYEPGDAATTLQVPVGWESLLHLYVLAMYREAEQEYPEAIRKRQEFEQEFIKWASSNDYPVSTQIGGSTWADAPVYGGLGGGVLIP